MNSPLLLTEFLHRARASFPGKEIVEYSGSESTHRYTYRDYHERVVRLAGALRELGVRPGDRVATLAWNHHRHLELYLAVPLAGAVLHTVNLRLEPAELDYILGHADDRALFADTDLLPGVERARDARPDMTVVVTDGHAPGTLNYEDLIASASPLADPPAVSEHDLAALCYTSGTTGSPKGVGYSHRALYLHTFAACLVDGHAISERDTVLHVVPMFHANAWGIPFAALMTGANQVLPGPRPAAPGIARAVEAERVTYTGMVPTVAVDLLAEAARTGADLGSLRALVLGGSPPTEDLVRSLEEQLRVPVFQGWGMTEISPMGTFSRPLPATEDDPDARRAQIRKQGRLLPGLRWRLVDDDGRDRPHDGVSRGELLIRGPWVATAYFRDEHPESFADGWLRTGDIATIDPDGYLEIVDRAKDLIKSGGEWISSVALEEALTAHPAVAEAAVVAVPHERWQERPLAFVVFAGGADTDVGEVREWLREQVPRWWVPEDVIAVDALPRTSVGKLDKTSLRDRADRGALGTGGVGTSGAGAGEHAPAGRAVAAGPAADGRGRS
ncbi:fatty-acyl-CoA synthase [Prauserella aidingensis]|uniref:long-chain-fatty-acid--CoA ligase n=1 Tax=Prauserella aidingensis TaxID=387890 RepID=UPI0020A40810|nr:long-chain-fatty-acid--CoA ligase [Prauserella aidingensis]MCP2253778.1 fatty-acyl-CoA synthase [Prauserella aidingensis]